MNFYVTTTSPLPRSHLHALAKVNVVRSMWLFRHKFNADGSLSRYKSRLVSNGRSQQPWIDYDETFILVVKPATFHTVLSLTVSHDWPIHQLDVKNAFLHGHLSEICIIALLQSELVMMDLGSLNYFLGISAQRSATLLIIERAHMQNSNPFQTLDDTEFKLGLDGDPDSDPTFCGSLAGALYAEAEYRRVANVVAETVCLRNLLLGLHVPLSTATIVYCDNAIAMYLSTNYVQHQRTKHIKIDIHFVRDIVASGQVRVLHGPSRFQYANIFTQGLPTALFLEFRSSLNVRIPPAHTAEEY
ncbi:ribonuclease H-like domain-containing protein [Tanacetum coccineum]